MKNFLFALLALAGCASTSVQPVAPKENQVPIIIAHGSDGSVNWTCTVEDLNDKLVWVPCEFHNTTSTTTSSCIKVAFYGDLNSWLSQKPVAESRKFCSGFLAPNETKTNYAAFIKEKREALQKCGESLSSCVMLAGSTQKSE